MTQKAKTILLGVLGFSALLATIGGSIFLARKAKLVHGVEIVPAAIENAKDNAALNGISNAEFFCGESEKVFPEWAASNDAQADVVVVDPPRKGCDKALLDAILKAWSCFADFLRERFSAGGEHKYFSCLIN